jgi:hypothetical protein
MKNAMKVYSFTLFTGRLILSAIEMDQNVDRYTQDKYLADNQKF